MKKRKVFYMLATCLSIVIIFLSLFLSTKNYSIYLKSPIKTFIENETIKNFKQTLNFDVRNTDLNNVDLNMYTDYLPHIQFDARTIWPKDIKAHLDIDKILDLGKNPGLGIKKLNANGLTGKGINIAIIDQALAFNHIEIRDNLKYYDNQYCINDKASFHGTVVTSIAIGSKCGVAPKSGLYYFAISEKNINKNITDELNEIININSELDISEQIRVVSISMNLDMENEEIEKAINTLKKQNVFIIIPNMQEIYNFGIGCAGRKTFYDDPDNYKNYTTSYFCRNIGIDTTKILWIPIDYRTFASYYSATSYEYISTGGISIACPWLAGVYALCLQVDKELTPAQFIETSFETAYIGKTPNNSIMYLINPEGIINELYEIKDN